ncbi:restriction endonuclease subunit S [Campylobacter sp.]|uniref:restriction endonuclease subunit S n=1 Tax=Campylobacter sp. TaxID=205 RepID=UPI00259CA0B2|nr:restriction endonuclease subunit S [Campylobacter sp.]MBQ8819244.1 restriction endonuclease subunit S [Campylobacter sp.]
MNKIPKGWEVKKLKDIGKISSGGTPSTSNDNNFGGNIAWITPADLTGYKDKFISKGKRNLSEEGLKNSSAKILPKGTILFSSRAPIGYVAIAQNEISTNQGFKNLTPNESAISEYVYYYLLGSKNLAEQSASGTTFKEISATAFSNLPIPLPPLSEQKAIADKLDDSFAKIENAITNLINAKENLKLYKPSVLKSAFNGDLLPNTSPTHWEVKKLGEIFNVIGGGTPNTNNAEFWGGNISWISSADIDKENFNAIPRKFITENAIQNSATNLVPKNTIIVVTRVGLGKVAITKEPMCFSQDSQALIPFEKINVKFMAYQIKQIAQNFINISRGTTINGITKQNLKDCKICVPPLSEQNLIVAEIDRRFAIVDKTLNLIDKSIQNAKNLKQSILKKAFSGELRSDI